HAALGLVLGRYAGTDDVCFGSLSAGRPAEVPGAAAMVGMFANCLPIRVRLDDDRPMAEWLRGVAAEVAAARAVEGTPLVQARRAGDWPPGAGLHEPVLAVETEPLAALLDAGAAGAAGLAVHDPVLRESSEYPLTVVVTLRPELGLRAVYDAGRLGAA